MSSSSFKLLDGEWPILGQAPAVPASVLDEITSKSLGDGITGNLGYLSLGLFYIDVDLVEPHCSQRGVSSDHVRKLAEDFNDRGIFRAENSGVVIGLGDGWMQMKNPGPHTIKIATDSKYLHHLSLAPGGPIAQVIRGGHRTAAIKRHAASLDDPTEAYWLYTVLVPGEFLSLFVYLHYLIIFQVTNTLPPSLLNDYSCLDNLERSYLPNSYHRTTSNYADVAATLYASSDHPSTITSKLNCVLKRNAVSKVKITSFKHMLKFRSVVPHLVRLLNAGGVWTIDCETAYAALVKCRVEKVSYFIYKMGLF